ncbi:MAG: radical SAM protein [Candidatus Bathyarchaeum sp.]|nr:MAG: radical SAM protein [Candidatus Bathyarchaeum sp.]
MVEVMPRTSPDSASVGMFLALLENPLLRFVIRFLSSDRSKSGKNYLEIALDDYAGHQRSPHSPASRVTSWIVGLTIDLGCNAFGLNRNQARKALRVPYFKKGLVNILDGISKYGVTRPQRLAAPFLVVWNYTNACNLKCKHCYQSAEKPTPDELSTEERLEIIDQLDKASVASIAFSGGEPLMRKDFFEVAEYAAGKGMYISVATNGTLLTKRMVERLKEAGVGYVEVSLDGARRETHESFRGVNGCFDKTLRGIRNSVEAGSNTCIATTATKHNLYEIPDIVELGKNLGAKRIIVFNFIPTGRGKTLVNLDLSPTQREQLLKYLYNEVVNSEIEVLCTAPQYSRVCLQQSLITKRDVLSPTHFAATDIHGRAKSLTDFLGGCGAGTLYCAIQPNGLVTPCVFMPIVVGDLRKESFQDVWLHSKVMNDLRDREKLKGRCGRCSYKYVCGGCRARAYAYYHDYLTPDPGCIRELEEPSMPIYART